MAWDKRAPFNEKGLMHYPEPTWQDERNVGFEFRDVSNSFEASLRYVGYKRGRSAVYLMWVDDSTGVKYPMFMKDLDAVLLAKQLTKGAVFGEWVIAKRGQNYGIRLAT